MEQYTSMFGSTGTFLNAIEEVQPPPLHPQLSETWWTTVESELFSILKENESSDDELKKLHEVMDCFQIGYSCLSNALVKVATTNILKQIEVLINRPQSAQRTDEWYKEMMSILSASELYQLFASPRARGSLVLSKVVPKDGTGPSPRKSCMTMEMNPLDWGIRFEPVAKQFLEHLWDVEIREMGRLRHPTIESLAASPDGLITKVRRRRNNHLLGHLVEIKCPSSREVGVALPPNYWYQMQLQLEVTELPVCEYAEFLFRSSTAARTLTHIPTDCRASGNIFLLQCKETHAMKYEYRPLNDVNWQPSLTEGWEILETIPWYLETYWIQTVHRDHAWFQSIIPLLDEFWRDVEKARRGEFISPESSVKKKPILCAITD